MNIHGDSAESGSPSVRLEPVASLCSTGSCPTIYRSDRGTFVVQGYAITAEQAGIAVPDGELLVEIPVGLLERAHGVEPPGVA